MKIIKFFLAIVFIIPVSCSEDNYYCDKALHETYVNNNLRHEELRKEGKILEAIAEVKKVMAKDPDDYIAVSDFGAYKYSLCQRTRCSAEQLKEVYDYYKKAISMCENSRVAYFNIIEVLSELPFTKYHNDLELIKYLELYNSKYKKRSNLFKAGGEAKFRLGKIDEALLYLDEAIKINPKESMAYLYKGKCHYSRQEYSEAISFFNIALSLDSLSVGFHDRGYTHLITGNIEEAISDFNSAISIDSFRYESFVGLSEIEGERKNFDLACEYIVKAKDLTDELEVFEGNTGRNSHLDMIDSLSNKYCRKL